MNKRIILDNTRHPFPEDSAAFAWDTSGRWKWENLSGGHSDGLRGRKWDQALAYSGSREEGWVEYRIAGVY